MKILLKEKNKNNPGKAERRKKLEEKGPLWAIVIMIAKKVGTFNKI